MVPAHHPFYEQRSFRWLLSYKGIRDIVVSANHFQIQWCTAFLTSKVPPGRCWVPAFAGTTWYSVQSNGKVGFKQISRCPSIKSPITQTHNAFSWSAS